MFSLTQPTFLFQIFCESMFDSEVIFKSMDGPNDICQRGLQAWIG